MPELLHNLFWIATITGGVLAALVGLDVAWGYAERWRKR